MKKSFRKILIDFQLTEMVNMARCKVVVLSIVSVLLLMLLPISVSAETTDTNESNSTLSTSENNTGLIENEISLNLNFLATMLKMLDLNLRLINETLNAHVEEYPFLKSTMEGTDEGIKGVDSIIAVITLSPDNLSDTNVTPGSLNEIMSGVNSSMEYPDGMIESANETMGQPNVTKPMILDMYNSIKTMTKLMNQFN